MTSELSYGLDLWPVNYQNVYNNNEWLKREIHNIEKHNIVVIKNR